MIIEKQSPNVIVNLLMLAIVVQINYVTEFRETIPIMYIWSYDIIYEPWIVSTQMKLTQKVNNFTVYPCCS